MSHYYFVEAYHWTPALQARFGSDGEGLHILTDEEVITLIMQHGRASITQEGGERDLFFENAHD